MFTKFEFKPDYIVQKLDSYTIYNTANPKYCKIVPLGLLDITENTNVDIAVNTEYLIRYLYQPADNLFVYEPVLIPLSSVLINKYIPENGSYLQYFPVKRLITDTESFAYFFVNSKNYTTQTRALSYVEIKNWNLSAIINNSLSDDADSFIIQGKLLIDNRIVIPVSDQTFSFQDLIDDTGIAFDYTDTLNLFISDVKHFIIVDDNEHKDHKKFNDWLESKFGKGEYWLWMVNEKINYSTILYVVINDSIYFPKLFADRLMLDSLFDIKFYKFKSEKTISINLKKYITDDFLDISKVWLVGVRSIKRR